MTGVRLQGQFQCALLARAQLHLFHSQQVRCQHRCRTLLQIEVVGLLESGGVAEFNQLQYQRRGPAVQVRIELVRRIQGQIEFGQIRVG